MVDDRIDAGVAMLSEMWSAVTPKDIIVPLLTALGGWLAALRMSRSNEKIAREQHARVAEDELTGRLRVLMDGYTQRIRDLTAEVQELRVRVEACERKWRMRDASTDAAT